MAETEKGLKVWIPAIRCMECRALLVYSEDLASVRHFENTCDHAGKNFKIPTLELAEVKDAVGTG